MKSRFSRLFGMFSKRNTRAKSSGQSTTVTTTTTATTATATATTTITTTTTSPSTTTTPTTTTTTTPTTTATTPPPSQEMEICPICYEAPLPASKCRLIPAAEQWSVLPCGHKFGHKCIRRWFRDCPAPRTCPACREPAFRRCGHPITPAPLPSRGTNVARKLETRQIRKALKAQRSTKCAFCVKNEGEYNRALGKVNNLSSDHKEMWARNSDLDYDAHKKACKSRYESKWREWWDQGTLEGPRMEDEVRDHAYPLELCLV